MGVWQGVTRPYSSMPCGWATPETAISGVARPPGRQPLVVFYPFGHPTPYTYASQQTSAKRTNQHKCIFVFRLQQTFFFFSFHLFVFFIWFRIYLVSSLFSSNLSSFEFLHQSNQTETAKNVLLLFSDLGQRQTTSSGSRMLDHPSLEGFPVGTWGGVSQAALRAG
jgi:hypothetical protein